MSVSSMVSGVLVELGRLSEVQAPDPADVKPGWVALVIVLLLGAATVLLWRNMRKQLDKVRFEEKDIPGNRRPRPPAGPPASPPASPPA